MAYQPPPPGPPNTIKKYITPLLLGLSIRYMFHLHNTVVGGVITLNDIICKHATTQGQGGVIIE